MLVYIISLNYFLKQLSHLTRYIILALGLNLLDPVSCRGLFALFALARRRAGTGCLPLPGRHAYRNLSSRFHVVIMCYPSSNITYCIACLLCIGVILLNKFNSIQSNARARSRQTFIAAYQSINR